MIVGAELISILISGIVLFTGIVIMSFKKGKKVMLGERIAVDKEKAAIEEAIKEIELEESVLKRETELSWSQKKARELQQSNTGVTFPLYITILLISMLLIFLVVYKIMDMVVIAIPFAFLGIIIPEKIVESKIEKNVNSFNEELVKALRRMASVMRSGGSLKQALTDVVRSKSMPTIIRAEFRKVLTDIEYGLTIENALYKLYERIGSEDVQFLAIAVEIQRQLGGNIAQMFDSIGSAISNRRIMESDVRATLSQIKATSNILSAMPFVLGIGIFLVNPGYFDPLLQSTAGRLIILGCVSIMAMGIFVIKKLSKLDL